MLQSTIGSGLFTSSKGKDHNSVKRVTKRRRVQEFRQRRIGITPPLCLEMNQTSVDFEDTLQDDAPPRRCELCIIKITDRCSRQPDVNESSCLPPPLSWSAECCPHCMFQWETCRARNTAGRSAQPDFLNKVFQSIVISQRHFGSNAAG